MKKLNELSLEENERLALFALEKTVLKRLPGARLVLFGSKARGDGDEYSDIDVLILNKKAVEKSIKDEISWERYNLSLKLGKVISILYETESEWASPVLSETSLRRNVEKEGALI